MNFKYVWGNTLNILKPFSATYTEANNEVFAHKEEWTEAHSA